MLHLGDITKLSGYTAPIVDCIIGGSPCQDLSLAGKRAGLDGERSGLYTEQIRIVKEMRERDRRNGRTGVDIRPRYMVWENVPGAFSSNKAEDFRVVLEELAKIKDENAVIPQPPNGKWRTSGCIMGDGWSIAWRVLDTQFWGLSNYLVDGSVIIPGTPQRRKRIALVADFGGQSAPEILFVRKSVSGNIDESEQTREETSSDASRGIGADDRTYCFEPGAAKRLGGYVWEGIAPTLRTEVGDNRPSVAYTLKIRSGCEGGGKGALVQEDLSGTLATGNDQYLFQPVGVDVYNLCLTGGVGRTISTGGGNEHISCVIYSVENHPNDSRVKIDERGIVQTLSGRMGTGGGKSQANVTEGTSPTLTCTHGGEPVVCLETFHCTTEENKAQPQKARDYKDPLTVVYSDTSPKYIVRRLTPLECERLQGYPDGWTDIGEWTDSKGKKRQTSDAARYKALGNSIALPPWKWVLKDFVPATRGTLRWRACLTESAASHIYGSN